MTWETEITLLVRGLVQDLCSPQIYTDESLQQNIAIGAHFVKTEITFNTTYTIDLVTPDITPDPTTQDPKDLDFMNLVALKSACMILGGEVKIAAGKSISVSDAGASISMSGRSKEIKSMYDDMCSKYEHSKLLYLMYGNGSVRLAVTGPIYYNG